MTKNTSPHADAAAAALISFLNKLDTVQNEHGRLTIAETTAAQKSTDENVHAFVGYPIWCRTVYCSTLPTEHLLKTVQSFTVQHDPEPAVKILRAVRELLDDSAFVIFVQAFDGPRLRRDWLQDKCRVSDGGFGFVDFCGHLLV